ncbi:hypothetical protein QBC44DRAFT_371033 [Cladorrhinum sp. PSN332]|nr:hypothetical protein QBC44DRAFT_371033 [Cladorrhinum sp. PSN332]
MEERVKKSHESQEFFGAQRADHTIKERRDSNDIQRISDLFRRAFVFGLDPSYHHPLNFLPFHRNSHPPVYEFEQIASENPRLFGLTDRLRFGVTNAAPSRRNRSLLCWVPVGARAGDIVCVVHGYRFPMVIRRVPGPENHYRFLGISYVQGYMDGEALRDKQLDAEDLVFT